MAFKPVESMRIDQSQLAYSKRYKKCWLDFEFNQVTERYVNLVCASVRDNLGNVKEFWLHNDKKAQRDLQLHLSKFKKVVAYASVAEGRSFISLGLNPMDFAFKDLFVEYRLLSNHNDEINWGKQLVDGKVKRVRKPKPKWERTEEDSAMGFRPTHSLVEATYKLTGKIRDTKHKQEMRDLIISNPEKFTKKQRKAIQAYCTDDVIFLPTIEKKIREMILDKNPLLGKKTYEKQAVERAQYQSANAISESRGYDINVKATKNFSNQVGSILYDYQREVNKLFPDVSPFVWNKREGRFSMKESVLREWIEENNDTDRWKKTDGGALSLSLEAFQQHYDFKHHYPKDNFGAQIVGFLKLKQSLYGFSASNQSSTKKSFWDNVGSDGKVRPYLNGFAAQSSRSQPAATGFMFLKPAWMRALVEPPRGIYYGGIDYGSQEFLVSALLSGDKNMIAAYMSGDPYFYFAQQVGAVPKGVKRDKNNKETEKVRDLFKSTCVARGTLIRVKDRGYVEIEAVRPGDIVWDGEEWRACDGARYMGFKTVHQVIGHTRVTEDHRILSDKEEWHEYKDYKESEVRKWKVLEEKPEGLRKASASWSDVWHVARRILKNKIGKMGTRGFGK